MMTLDWKRCVVLAILAVSSVGLLASCGTPQPPAVVASSRAIAVDVAPATKGTISPPRPPLLALRTMRLS